MNPTIEFAKLSASGNDFICIDNRDGLFDDVVLSSQRVGHLARTLCRRGLGVGADGVIFAGQSEIEGAADIGARFFEADGSETELCGNGAACFTHWAVAARLVPDAEIKILTSAGVVLAKNSTGEYVRVCIPCPDDMQTDLELAADFGPCKCDFVVVGIPHVVTYVDDIEKAEVADWGPALRHHPRFQPRGANADFVQVLGEGSIAVRTFEFGVEGETLACGTGSAAAAILSAIRFGWPEEYFQGRQWVQVRARSGDVLKVSFKRREDGTIGDVCLETIVRFVYSGRTSARLAAKALDGGQGA